MRGFVPELTPAEISRFYSKLRIGGCGLTWAGSDTHKFGYGYFKIYRNGKCTAILAHRLAYKLFTGEDPGEAMIRHACDIPPCCTPDCLTPGTQAENIRDSRERDRMDLSGLQAFRDARSAQAHARRYAPEKRCPKCKKVKPMADFNRSSSSPDGHTVWCKACSAEAHRRRNLARGQVT